MIKGARIRRGSERPHPATSCVRRSSAASQSRTRSHALLARVARWSSSTAPLLPALRPLRAGVRTTTGISACVTKASTTDLRLPRALPMARIPMCSRTPSATNSGFREAFFECMTQTVDTSRANCDQIGGSISVMHEKTGLYVNLAAGQLQDNLILSPRILPVPAPTTPARSGQSRPASKRSGTSSARPPSSLSTMTTTVAPTTAATSRTTIRLIPSRRRLAHLRHGR